MKNQIRLSTFGIRWELGTMFVGFRDPEGNYTTFKVLDSPKVTEFVDIPRRVQSGFGISAIELMDQNLVNTTAQDRAEFVAALAREKVTLGMVGLSRCAGDANDEHRAEDLAALKELITTSAEMGAEQVRVVLLPPPVVPSPQAAPFEALVASLRELASHAREAGIRLTVENDDPVTSDPAQLLPILDALALDVGFVLDTGNVEPVMIEVISSFREGRELRDVDAEPLYEFVRRMLPRAEVVHIKTYGFHDDGQSRVYDLERVLHLVADSGYAGPLTIEYGGFDPDDGVKSIIRTAELIRAT